MAQVVFFVAYRRRWRAQKADLRRRTCREKQTCARNRSLSTTNLCQGPVRYYMVLGPSKSGDSPDSARRTYLVCTAKLYSMAVSVYIPSENRPIEPFLTGYVQEIGFSARSNRTYEVCAFPSYCQVSKQRAIDIGPLLPHFTIVLREVGSRSTDFLGGRCGGRALPV